MPLAEENPGIPFFCSCFVEAGAPPPRGSRCAVPDAVGSIEHLARSSRSFVAVSAPLKRCNGLLSLAVPPNEKRSFARLRLKKNGTSRYTR